MKNKLILNWSDLIKQHCHGHGRDCKGPCVFSPFPCYSCLCLCLYVGVVISTLFLRPPCLLFKHTRFSSRCCLSTPVLHPLIARLFSLQYSGSYLSGLPHVFCSFTHEYSVVLFSYLIQCFFVL